VKLISIFGAAAMSMASLATAQGVFQSSASADPAQIARGQSAYAAECLLCHGPALEGNQFGPALKGAEFEAKWRESTRAAFSERIRTTMPPGKLGVLSSATLNDIEAFILRGGASGAQAAAAVATASPPAAPVRSASSGSSLMGPRQSRDDDPVFQAALKARADRLNNLASVTDATLRSPAPGDWLMWRRAYDGLGYSPLRQITRANVKNLRSAWGWVLPTSGNQITPLVYDGVMFIGSGPAVHALDAATGELLWQYSRPSNNAAGARAPASKGRSLAIYDDKIFTVTPDGKLAALNFRTGKPVWEQQINSADSSAGFSVSSGPLVAKGVVMIGVSLGISTPGGAYILGLDAATGAEIWRFHTIARPGQPGGDTWNGAPLSERFGGGVWTVGSFDPELNLAYFGIGNTYNSAGLLEPRPGATSVTNNDALYTDSTVALRPETGELIWHFQHHKRDVWDLDWVFEQSVLTLPVAGRSRKVVVTGGKVAVFEAVDAATGAFVFAKDMGVQNIFLAIDPRTGEKTINPAVLPEANKPKLLCPNSVGARNWTATAINPESAVLFVPLLENCADYTYVPRDAAQTALGGLDMRFSARTPPDHDGKFGQLAAVDLKTQRILWTHRQRIPYASAALATAGGVVFAGDVDRNFVAYDQSTGKMLWSTRLAAAAESYPIAYSVGGRQFIAVVAGSGSPWGSSGRGNVPEVTSTTAGTSVAVFELPR
jgi:alcohol dehydrogenase (cytochrome c)